MDFLKASVLEKQCAAARCLQAWWRRVATTLPQRHTSLATTLPTTALRDVEQRLDARPLPYLEAVDIVRLSAVSWAHNEALYELGLLSLRGGFYLDGNANDLYEDGQASCDSSVSYEEDKD